MTLSPAKLIAIAALALTMPGPLWSQPQTPGTPQIEQPKPKPIEGSGITGWKYLDQNSNGTRDGGETGLAGWKITVTNSSGAVVCTTLTGPNGNYWCPVSTPGVYYVKETLQSGWVQTEPVTVFWTVTVSKSGFSNRNFGNVRRTCHGSSCASGIKDDFLNKPEPATPDSDLKSVLKGCPGTMSYFDEPVQNRCFGTTLSCAKNCQASAAKFCTKLHATSAGSQNDEIALLQGTTIVWKTKISALQAGGNWNAGAKLEICLDLAALPVSTDPAFAGVTNILAALQDGDLDLLVKSNTAVDYLTLDRCCCGRVCPRLSKSLATGFTDSTGVTTPLGNNDDEWVVADPPGNSPFHPAVVFTSGSWNPAQPGSGWVSTNANGEGPEGIYTYRTCFCLNEGFFGPKLSLDLRSDNVLKEVSVNGNVIFKSPAIPIAGSFVGPILHVETANPGIFRPGRNCVEIKVEDFGVLTGLNVGGTVTAENGLCCADTASPCPNCSSASVEAEEAQDR